MPTPDSLLQVRGVTRRYRTRGRRVTAVDNVSFEVQAGEAVALVGESGCGKSTLARLIVGLDVADEGDVLLAGERLTRRRRREVGLVLQNPASALDPRMRIGQILGEPLGLRFGAPRGAVRDSVIEGLGAVALDARYMELFPHQLSGGQQQRVSIARALIRRPRLLILDEPTAALDVSVQAQVVNLLADLRDRLGLSYLFISHDLALVATLADRVLVMHSGRIVESGPVSQVLQEPRDPYTRLLVSSVPSIHSARLYGERHIEAMPGGG